MKKFIVITLLLLGVSCINKTEEKNNVLKIVTTTTMITDLVKNIGGNTIELEGLMGAGVDPHLYKASEGDVTKLFNADIIFYNGLHLEGKLVEVFEKMADKKTTIGLGEFLPKEELIGSDYFASNYDPHVWFSIAYFKEYAKKVGAVLAEKDPKNKTMYEANTKTYLEKLSRLEITIQSQIDQLPLEKRILVTAHDAFNYFGKSYGFEVIGLQGLSTATEAGVKDVQNLSNLIIEKQVKAIFLESSVPRRTIEALQEAVKAKGFDVKIGGSLYSDALGDTNSVEGSYIGMFEYNVNTIVSELK